MLKNSLKLALRAAVVLNSSKATNTVLPGVMIQTRQLPSVAEESISTGSIKKVIQKAQLMLTNPRDAFRDQSRSPYVVPFHMLGIASSCAIVGLTLSLGRAVFPIFDFKNVVTLKSGSEVTQGH